MLFGWFWLQGVQASGGSYGVRSSLLLEQTLGPSPCNVNGGIGVLRGYFTSVSRSSKSGVSKSFQVGKWNLLLTNPRFRRFFSSETPKKKSKLICFRLDF